jgi:hypothetical protein
MARRYGQGCARAVSVALRSLSVQFFLGGAVLASLVEPAVGSDEGLARSSLKGRIRRA